MISQLSLFAEVQTGNVVKPKRCHNVIYETKGRAREYRELACNLYTGCDHGCVYCYAPQVLQRDRQAYHTGAKPRKDIIRKLRNDAAWFAAKGEHRQILFCFSCDPYQHIDEEYQFTRQAIQICHEAGLNICTLTKGGSRALRDIDLFTPRDAFAVTLTTLDDAESKQWEPRAAMPDDRINSLARFHEAGIPTWVSLEPVLSPDTVFEIIRQTKDVVDEFKVGILNYHPQAKRIDWSRFAYDVRELLESLGCNYYLKHDLRKYLR